MTNENDVLIERLRTVADDVPVPPIPWNAVAALSHRRRQRRAAAVTSSALAAAALVLLASWPALHQNTTPPAAAIHPRAVPATTPAGGGTTDPGAAPRLPMGIKSISVSGRFDQAAVARRSALSKVAPYELELADGTNGRLVSAALLLLPTNAVPDQIIDKSGQIAPLVIANAVAFAQAKQVAPGRWSVRLDVPTSLGPGKYTVVFVQVGAWTRSGPGTGAVGAREFEDIPNFATLTVEP
ncbi:MAG TPA: hypothetical protein VIC82_03050 [Candidatus Nanopelagicales bacterium]